MSVSHDWATVGAATAAGIAAGIEVKAGKCPACGRSGRRMPRQKPGDSVQVVSTPPEFLAAVAARWGPIEFDLACTRENCVATYGFFHPEFDALTQCWSAIPATHLWLNPPFERIGPPRSTKRPYTKPTWVTKCAYDRRLSASQGGRQYISFLTPASVCANWFTTHVQPYARVYQLQPRLTFVGETHPFPKDLILSRFGEEPGFEVWRWKDA